MNTEDWFLNLLDLGVISWVWLPGKYLILCYSQSSSQFSLFLNLSMLLSCSNKHFKLPFLFSVYVSCGNTAQTGFVSGNRHSWDMGARHSPGRRHQVCTCLSHCTTSRRHIKQPVKIRGKPNYQKRGLQRIADWGEWGLPAGDKRTGTLLFTLQPSSPKLFLLDKCFHSVSQEAGDGN